ncbi:MAG TPA: prepilin-type N-terminal cleavage/methylation domain-containing protein [Nitrospiraceae bacterium]|jgi:general secretion pathway protein G|nr:prepilin-type N-terminal cleavage/methylation domain-containing protein [Nitrospiraceae bacterium]
MRWQNQRGFTLLELSIALSIATILVTLAYPSFTQSVVKAREAGLKQNLFVIRDVIDQFRADNGNYPDALADLVTSGYLKQMPIDPITKSNETWQEIPDEEEGGVFDVRSGSELVSREGTPYNQW